MPFIAPQDEIVDPPKKGGGFTAPEDEVEKTQEPGVLDTINDYAGGVIKGALAPIVTDLPKLAGRGAEAIGRLLPEGMQHKSLFTEMGESNENLLEKAFPTNPETANTFGGKLASGLGGATALIGTAGLGEAGAAAKGLQLANTAVPSAAAIAAKTLLGPSGVLGGAMTGVPEYEAAKRAGASDEQAFKTLLKNYFIGTASAAPAEGMLSRLNDMSQGMLAKHAVTGLHSAATMVTQRLLSNSVAKADYDPERDPFWGVADAALVGGSLGLLMPGIGLAMREASPENRLKIQQKVRQLESKAEAIKTADESLPSTGDPKLDALSDATLLPEQLDIISQKKIAQLESEKAQEDAKQRQKEIDDIENQLEKDDIALEKSKQKIAEQPTPEKGAKPEPKGTLLPEQIDEFKTQLDKLYEEKGAEPKNPEEPTEEATTEQPQNPLRKEAEDKINEFMSSINEEHAPNDKENAANGDKVRFEWMDSEKEGRILNDKSPHGFIRVQTEDGVYPIERSDIVSVSEKGEPNPHEGEVARDTELYRKYKQLQEAKSALAKIAPEPRPRGNKALDKALGVDQKPEKTVHMSEGEAIKKQIQDFYRGVKEGVTRGKDQVNTLLEKIQGVLKGERRLTGETNRVPFTTQQISSILTKVRKTNLFTAGSVSRLSAFVDKVAANADYAAKLKEANELQSKIEGKKNSKLNTPAERDLLKSFSEIDPSSLSDVDSYLGAARDVNSALRYSAKDRNILDISKAQEYLNKVQPEHEQAQNQKEMDRAEREQERAQAFADKLGLSFEEAQDILQGETPEEERIADDNKKQAIREELTNLAEEARTTLPDDIEGLNDAQKEDVNTIKNADLSLLSPDQLKTYIKTIDRIATNKDFGFSGRLSSIIKSAQDFKTLKERLGPDSHIIKLNNHEYNLTQKIASIPVFIRSMFGGLSKEAANLQQYMGMNGVNGAHVESKEASLRLAEDIKALNNKDHNGFNTESVWRQSLFGELIKSPVGEDATQWLADTKEVIKQDIENRRAQGQSDNAATEQKLYDDFKDARTVEEVKEIMKKVDPVGYEIVDKAISHFGKVVDEAIDVSERYHGKRMTKQENYSGPRVWQSTGKAGENEVMFKDVLGNVGGYSRALPHPKLMHSAKDVNNQPRRDALLNLNKHATMINGIENSVFNTKAVDHQIRVRENISRRAEIEKMFGAKEGDDARIQNAKKLYSTLFGKEGLYDKFERQMAGQVPNNPDRWINDYLEPLRKIGYSLSLGGPTQYLKQQVVLANVIARIGIEPLPFREMVENPEGAKDFFSGHTVALRGQQRSNFSLGHVDVPETGSEAKNIFERWGDKGFNSVLGTKSLIKGDVHAAQLSYAGFYKHFLQEKGGEWQGFDAEAALKNDPIRQEAHAYAKQKVDELQGVSNPAEMGTWLKSQATSAQLIKSALIPFGSFSTNTKTRMWNDTRTLWLGNKEQKAEAAKDLAASAVEQASFNGLSLGLKAMLAMGASQLASSLGLPDKLKKTAKQQWDNMVDTFTVNLSKDLLPIVLVKPIEEIGAQTINSVASIKKVNQWLHNGFGKDKKSQLIKTKQDRTPVEVALDNAGVLGVGIDRVLSTWDIGKEAVTGENKEGHKLTQEQKNFAAYVGMLTAANMTGYFPSDLLFPLKHELQVTPAGRRRVNH